MDQYIAETDKADVERFTVRNVFRPGVLVKVYLLATEDVFRYGRIISARITVVPDPHDQQAGGYRDMLLTVTYIIAGVDDEGEDNGMIWTDWDGDLVTSL